MGVAAVECINNVLHVGVAEFYNVWCTWYSVRVISSPHCNPSECNHVNSHPLYESVVRVCFEEVWF